MKICDGEYSILGDHKIPVNRGRVNSRGDSRFSSRFYPRENGAVATLRECGAGTGKENAKCGRRIGKQRKTPLVPGAWKTAMGIVGSRGGDGGGIHTRIENTRFTLRGNSGVHSRTSKSQNSISVNRCWWT